MPFYDIGCNDCEEDFADVYASLESEPKCPVCKKEGRIKIHPVATIGPMPSKPLVVKQIGREFESRAEFNQYQRENPGFEVLSANSSKWKQHKDLARERVETRAKKMGFRDHEERVAHRKKVKENVV